jgi:hypothetical protein
LTAKAEQRGLENLAEAGRFFTGKANVQHAARDLVAALDEVGVPYAIIGAIAVNLYGHPRTTIDVDVLLTAEGLRTFKERWLGRGWVDRFPGSKNMRDTRNNVKIDVLITGQYPGDGKPKPVRFPDPEDVAIEIGDLKTIELSKLIELKLASGMTSPDRPRDFDDVIQLIRSNGLTRQFASKLNPWVRDKYVEHWEYAQRSTEDD